ncbi:class I SAM-dependent methyltransferase [Caballeronia zhejiangensis]|uniref:Methyltransferase type 11 domain-containing protein n=1 Tax=Caballeronia zhejiangensis TaxID=871203 RepID=A0A656QCQ3_9BURK|nr:methyltransferase domain-containing protein [Caballeronia zhejiangensis]KDR25945.1 hypothetical protein BG60_26330 [Caballeronia zhejiangensis]
MSINPPPFNLAAVEAVTPHIVANVERILQTHRYAADDRDHVARLMDWLAPAEGASIVDIGCGIGEVARLAHEARPDLRFTLVNISPVQLSYCPTGDGFDLVQCDAHAMPLPPESFDYALMNSALSNMDAGPALKEAARVLKPGGALLVTDFLRLYGDNSQFERDLGARALTVRAFRDLAYEAGFMAKTLQFGGDDAHFRALMPEHADHILAGVTYGAWRLTKIDNDMMNGARREIGKHMGDVALRALIASPDNVAAQKLQNDLCSATLMHIGTGPETRVCLSCGAHTNEEGALPCGH